MGIKVKILIGIVGFIVVMNLISIVFSGTDSESELDKNIENTNQYDDEEYIKFVQNYCNILGDDAKGISTSADNNNYLGIQHFSENLKDHSLTALNNIDNFKLSSKLRPFNNEFKLALEDSYKAGKYGESGGKNHNTNDILLATEYLTKSRIHLEKALKLIPDNL